MGDTCAAKCSEGEPVRIEIMACAAPEVAPAAAPEAAPAKRPRGRPPKAATFDGPALAPAVAKRPRGRPPGTGKNQKAAAAAALVLQTSVELESAMSCSSQLSSGSLSEGKKARRRKSSVPVKAE